MQTAAHSPPRADADGGTQSAARALAADHELVAPHAERGRVLLQIAERGIAVVERGRVGVQRRQPVSRREHDRTEAPHQIGRTGGVYHFLHPEGIAAVQPQDACGVHRRRKRREQQRGDATVRRRNTQLLDADGLVGAHRAHGTHLVSAFSGKRRFARIRNMSHVPAISASR